ncbi:hypothetical protein D3C72_1616550 [compost metagenome]
MGDHLLDPGLQRDADYLLEVVEIDAAGGFQPEAVTGTGLGHRLILVAAGQASHGEELDRAAAHVLEQGDGGVDGHNSVRLLGTEGAGGDLHHAGGAGGGDKAVDQAVRLTQQRPAGAHSGEHLVDVLGLQLASQLGHHGGLAGIPRPQTDGEGVVDKPGVLPHVGDGGGHIRVVLGEHADQYMALGRLIDVDGILSGSCQHVEADTITVVVGNKGHQRFS